MKKLVLHKETVQRLDGDPVGLQAGIVLDPLPSRLLLRCTSHLATQCCVPTRATPTLCLSAICPTLPA